MGPFIAHIYCFVICSPSEGRRTSWLLSHDISLSVHVDNRPQETRSVCDLFLFNILALDERPSRTRGHRSNEKQAFPLIKAEQTDPANTDTHLRMCPGAERWLRPRWFTAWTIILPVQLTLPCERKRERERAELVRCRHAITPRAAVRGKEQEVQCECQSWKSC